MNININIAPNAEELGVRAAKEIASLINKAISERGEARIVLSTGASQFETLRSLVKEDVDWSRVEMFHLDEYVGLPMSHIASFRGYLKERFIDKVNLKAYNFVSGEGDVEDNIKRLSAKLEEKIVDVGVIGIGENGHIAFNDPPADFDTTLSYKVVKLDERCRRQQVGEGWFKSLEDVPECAITMCPRRIMSARSIVTAVPHSVKAEAIFNTLTSAVDPKVPATLLKTHPDWHLFIDSSSAAKLFK